MILKKYKQSLWTYSYGNGLDFCEYGHGFVFGSGMYEFAPNHVAAGSGFEKYVTMSNTYYPPYLVI